MRNRLPMFGRAQIVSDGEEDGESNSANWNFAPVTTSPDDTLLDSYLLYDNRNHNHDDDTTLDNLSTGPNTANTQGILIVDGRSEASASNRLFRPPTNPDLSYPGTESLPTEIDSLHISLKPRREPVAQTRDHSPDRNKTPFIFSKAALSMMLVIAAMMTISTCFLLWDRQNLLHRNQILDQTLLELQKKQGRSVCPRCKQTTSTFDWEKSDSSDPGKVLLADNCWFKAEVELGKCVNEAKDSFSEFSSDAARTLHDLLHWDEDDEDSDGPFAHAGMSWEALSDASYAVASAAVSAMDSMVQLSKAVDTTILSVVEHALDAVENATYTLNV